MPRKPAGGAPGDPVVFISSTVEDLGPIRAAAENAAKRAGFRPEMMEYFGASGRPSLDECLARVARAHVVVAISAHRFGWIPEDQPAPGGKSITQLECEHADAGGRGVEILPFVVDEAAPWPEDQRDEFILNQAMRDGKASSELFARVQRDMAGLQRFKSWLNAKPRETFRSAEDFEVKVLDALHKWRARHDEFAPASPPLAGALDRRALRPYLELLASRVSGLPLRGVDVGASDATGEPRRMDLSNVYVGLKTTTLDEAGPAPDARKGRPSSSADVERVPVSALDATIRERRVALLGDPGSGKSTFVNHLALCLAQHVLAPDAGWLARLPGWPAGEGLVPIVVTLRDLAVMPRDASSPPGADALWQFIERGLERDATGDAAPALKRALEGDQAIVLLDGLDEVTGEEPRKFVRAAVAAFFERHRKCRYVVTCRTLAWQDPRAQLPGVPAFTLAPFDHDDIDRFIGTWHAELRRVHAIDAAREDQLATGLRAAVRRPDLARLAPNPLLLTVMALVHTHKGVLPDARAQLYEDTVDLLLWRWEQVKLGAGTGSLRALLERAGCKDIDLKRALWTLAFEAHRDGGASDDPDALADIAEHRLLKSLARLCTPESLDWAGDVVEVIRSRAGLLIERAPEVFTLPHRTFQECFAGAHLASLGNFASEAISLFDRGAYWRTAILLGVGRLIHVSGETDRPLALVAGLCPGRTPVTAEGWRRAWLAGEVLREIGVARAGSTELGQDLVERVPRRLVELIEAGALTPVERAAAGNALAGLGDPRFRADRWYLPDDDGFGFRKVEAGPFTMGSDPAQDKDARKGEQPQHRLDLPEFYVAQCPVTVAQFRAFVEETGFDVGAPDGLRGIPNHPVTRVSWHEALAYGRWLTDRLRGSDSTPGELRERLHEGWDVTLPSEAEWEKAARGEEGLVYPWGNQFDAARANGQESGVSDTTTVGLFPQGASPCGALDMSGNVWEWTRSLWVDEAAYPYPSKPAAVRGRERLDAPDDVARVVRGGSFSYYANNLRAAFRHRIAPDLRFALIGFRVVASRLRS
jgi:formylglycine-generating enzyme required for sulfatase activity